MWFIFGACLINSQSTQEPTSELLNDTEEEKDTSKSIKLSMRIPKDIKMELTDGISIEYSIQHFNLINGGVEGALIGELTVGEDTTSFELELDPHSFKELLIGNRLIRLSVTGFNDFALQVEVLDKPLSPLTLDETQVIFDRLELSSSCGKIRGTGNPSDGIWRLRTRGRCTVGIGLYSGRVLYIDLLQNQEEANATE